MSETAANIQAVLAKLVDGYDLSQEEAIAAMVQIMDGNATSAQIAGLATALRMKGETVEEITGFAMAMRQRASQFESSESGLLDTCGTGGDGANTFNISTTAAIVAAAGGIRVAKHGNRAMSSRSGSADVLEALGVRIELTPEQAGQCLQEVGICFMFAQLYHASMKHAAAPRKELGFRNFFNLLGPLTNPAGAELRLLGVSERRRTELLAEVLKRLGGKRALVVSSEDGLDEISISAPTQVTELIDGQIRTYMIKPDDLGLEAFPLTDISGGDAVDNARIIRAVLEGDQGARRNIVLANAGACFYAAGQAATLQEGVKLASRIIDSGSALAKLQQLITYTGELSHVSG